MRGRIPYMKFQVLSDGEASEVYEGALEVLQNVGFKIQHEQGQELLRREGASFGPDGMTARIPKKLVERCVGLAPRKVLFAGRTPKNDLELEAAGDFFVRVGRGTEPFIFDLEGGKWRKVTVVDSVNWIKLVDALPNINICHVPDPVDLFWASRDVKMMQLQLENTEKHFSPSLYSAKSNECAIRLAALVMGGREELKRRPIIHGIMPISSPLQYSHEVVERMFAFVRSGIPFSISDTVLAGGTGPVTIEGSLVISIAELLSGIVLSQLASPGTPVVSSIKVRFLDMRVGTSMEDTVDELMGALAIVQIVRNYLHIPTYCHVLGTDSHLADGQAIMKDTFGGILSVLAGANIISSAGRVGARRSLEQLVIDDEIFGMVRRIVRGMEINKEMLGLDAIARVGPGGNFLGDQHTVRHVRPGPYIPSLFNHDSLEAWESRGGKDFYERAREKAYRLIKEHEPARLDEKLSMELRKEVESYEKEVQHG